MYQIPGQSSVDFNKENLEVFSIRIKLYYRQEGSFVHCRGLPALAHGLGGDETICIRLAPRRNPGYGTMRHELYTLTDGKVARYKRRLKR